MLRILIPYTRFWVRLWYRILHDVAHWCLRLIPMSSLLRHHVAGAVALIPYLMPVWVVTIDIQFSWTAYGVATAITIVLLLLVRRVEVRHAALRR